MLRAGLNRINNLFTEIVINPSPSEALYTQGITGEGLDEGGRGRGYNPVLLATLSGITGDLPHVVCGQCM